MCPTPPSPPSGAVKEGEDIAALVLQDLVITKTQFFTKWGFHFVPLPFPRLFFWWDRNIPPRPIDANSLVCGISDIGLNINTVATIYNFPQTLLFPRHNSPLQMSKI